MKKFQLVFTVTVFVVFVEHKSIETIALETALVIEAMMLTIMRAVTTFVNIYRETRSNLFFRYKQRLVNKIV